jgi:hypothetical protein
MIRPQHDSQGKKLSDPDERRGRQTGSARMINRNAMKFWIKDLRKETWLAYGLRN